MVTSYKIHHPAFHEHEDDFSALFDQQHITGTTEMSPRDHWKALKEVDATISSVDKKLLVAARVRHWRSEKIAEIGVEAFREKERARMRTYYARKAAEGGPAFLEARAQATRDRRDRLKQAA